MKRKRSKGFRRLMAVALAAVLTVSSFTPAAMQTVQAAGGDVITESESPFNKNVALGKDVTVTSVMDAVETSVPKLVDGNKDVVEDWWEPAQYTSNEYPLDIIVDLKDAYIIDQVALYWRQAAPAKRYEVQVSADKETWVTVGKEESTPITEDIGNETIKKNYTFANQTVRYVKVACKEASAYNTYTLREIEVYSIGGIEESLNQNQALGKSAYASLGNDTISLINDGNDATVWATGNGVMDETEVSTAYCYIDLGEVTKFNEIKIDFSDAFAASYQIDIASDEAAIEEENITSDEYWENIADNTMTENAPQIINLEEIKSARYVKLTGTPSTYQWGLEVYEMQVNLNRDALLTETIYLNKSSALITAVGDTVQLYAQVLPANAEDKESLEWISSDDKVVTVEDGLVTATGLGTAVISAKIGEIKAECEIRVAAQLAAPIVSAKKNDENAIMLSWENIADALGYRILRSENGAPYVSIADSVEETVYTDTTVEAGKTYTYKVVAVGDANNADSNESEATAAITIPLAVEGVVLNKGEAELIVGGEALDLAAKISPDNATIQSIKWTSSNQEVADFTEDFTGKTSAKVMAKNVGTADITVYVTDDLGNTVDEVCSVTIKAKLAAPVVSAEKTGDREITVIWNDVDNAGFYDVYRAAGKDGEFELVEEAAGLTTTEYIDTISEELSGNTYRYQVVAKPAAEDAMYIDSPTSNPTTAVQIGEISPFGANVALGKTVMASSEKDGSEAVNVVDGILNTQWESATLEGDFVENLEYPQSCTIDLGQVYSIDNVVIQWWTAAPASKYTVEVSEDGETFDVVGTGTEATLVGNVAKVGFPFSIREARYVKVNCEVAFRYNCYTISEIEVYTPGTVIDEDAVAVEQVLISQSSITVQKDKNAQLFAQVLPANLADSNPVEWSSDNEDAATIDKTGKITAIAAGKANITAAVGGKEVTCEVTVTEVLETPVVEAKLDEKTKKEISITWSSVSNADNYEVLRAVENGEYELLATVEGDTAYSDTDVDEGKVYSYKVVAKSNQEIYTDSIASAATDRIVVPIRVISVTLDKSYTVPLNEEKTLTATIIPKNATDQKITWESDDSSIAEIDAETGIVTGKQPGVTTIKATVDEKSVTCTVIVTKQLNAPAVRAELAEDESFITVSWDGVNHADDYVLSRSEDGKNYTDLPNAEFEIEPIYYIPEDEFETEPVLVTYKDTDLIKGKTYWYQVKAISNEDYYLASDASVTKGGVLVPIHVTGVELDDTSVVVEKGEDITLDAAVSPANASDQSVNWKSADPDIAIVENGKITGVALGITTITVTTVDGSKEASCEVTVAEKLDTPKVKAVKTADNKAIHVSWNVIDHADAYVVLRAEEDGEYSEVADAVMTTEDGVVTYVDRNITEDKTYCYQVAASSKEAVYLASEVSEATEGIRIPVSVTGVTLSRTAAELAVGDEITLTAAVSPAGADNKNISWKSSNDAVAVVIDGKVKAVAQGQAVITVTTQDGAKTASCEVSIKAVPQQSDTDNPGQGSTQDIKAAKIVISGISKNIAVGKKVTLTAVVTPENTTNKAVTWTSSNTKYATVNAKGVVRTKNAGRNKTVTITATAADGSGVKATYKIKIMPTAVKKITLKASSTSVAAGKKVTIQATVSPSISSEKMNKTLKWTSSNTKYATVNAKGVVTTKKAGKGKKVKITAKATDGSNKKKTITIKIK